MITLAPSHSWHTSFLKTCMLLRVEKTEGVAGTSRVVHCLRLDLQSVALVSLWCAHRASPQGRLGSENQCKRAEESYSEVTRRVKDGLHHLTLRLRRHLEGRMPRACDTMITSVLGEEGSYGAVARCKKSILRHPKSVHELLSLLFRHLARWFTAFLRPSAEGIAQQEELRI